MGKSFAATSTWSTSANTCAIGNNLSTNNTTGFNIVASGYRSQSLAVQLNSEARIWSSTKESSLSSYFCHSLSLFNSCSH